MDEQREPINHWLTRMWA